MTFLSMGQSLLILIVEVLCWEINGWICGYFLYFFRNNLERKVQASNHIILCSLSHTCDPSIYITSIRYRFIHSYAFICKKDKWSISTSFMREKIEIDSKYSIFRTNFVNFNYWIILLVKIRIDY